MKAPRHEIQARERKALQSRYLAEYGYSLSEDQKDVKVEKYEGDLGTIYFVAGVASIHEAGGKLRPTLLFQGHVSRLTQVVVDQGAVPYICRGADVMRPGVKRVEGSFPKGVLVAVVDERFGKPLALGVSLLSSDEIEASRGGRVVEVFHFVGDKLWRLIKSL